MLEHTCEVVQDLDKDVWQVETETIARASGGFVPAAVRRLLLEAITPAPARSRP